MFKLYKKLMFNNMSEESEKNKKFFIVKKLLRPAPSQGMVEQDLLFSEFAIAIHDMFSGR